MRTSHLIFLLPICKIGIKLFAFCPVVEIAVSNLSVALRAPLQTSLPCALFALRYLQMVFVRCLKTTLLVLHSSEMQGCGFSPNTSRCCKCSTCARLLSQTLGCWHLVVSDPNNCWGKLWVWRNSRVFRQKVDFLAATAVLPQGFRTGCGCWWV